MHRAKFRAILCALAQAVAGLCACGVQDQGDEGLVRASIPGKYVVDRVQLQDAVEDLLADALKEPVDREMPEEWRRDAQDLRNAYNSTVERLGRISLHLRRDGSYVFLDNDVPVLSPGPWGPGLWGLVSDVLVLVPDAPELKMRDPVRVFAVEAGGLRCERGFLPGVHQSIPFLFRRTDAD